MSTHPPPTEFVLWRADFARLLRVARLGGQFPEAAHWRALLELLSRTGPRGRPMRLARGRGGLPRPRALAHLHQLQRIAREFLEAHRVRPGHDARAFSSALAALELPVVSQTRVRLVAPGKVPRFQLVHERLADVAVRFTVILEQRRGGHLVLGRDELVRTSASFERVVNEACDGSAPHARRVLADVPGLTVLEVVRGQLGPFVTARTALPPTPPVEVAALRAAMQQEDSAVLCVSLERVAAELTRTSLQDPWLADEPLEPGQHLARERRLFCTPDLEVALRELVARTGKAVLIRSR